MTGPSQEQLLSEAAQIARHFHWSLDAILDLEHHDRRHFLAEIDAMTDDVAYT